MLNGARNTLTMDLGHSWVKFLIRELDIMFEYYCVKKLDVKSTKLVNMLNIRLRVKC